MTGWPAADAGTESPWTRGIVTASAPRGIEAFIPPGIAVSVPPGIAVSVPPDIAAFMEREGREP
ncbi:hypothetical protein OG372_02070 [Streptomyces sp. NBC_01020]|uniref:hypothetical protein n=1 Tax=Streptomyces sp. NBC_01020 TaxID=2903722 RepID=UPI0038695602|nr:hypothetical protein OG372_02070 [Streptomyces sp. NBC_01020]